MGLGDGSGTAAMYVLYHHPYSQHARRVVALCAAAGLEGRDYLAGTTPSIADLSVGSNITQFGLADAAPTTPNVAAWYRRVFEIEGFRKSLPQG